MATKGADLFIKNKYQKNHDIQQFTNLNLNQQNYCFQDLAEQSFSKKTNFDKYCDQSSSVVLNTKKEGCPKIYKNDSNFKNQNFIHKNEENKKSWINQISNPSKTSNNNNNSTLSLHISAYENSMIEISESNKNIEKVSIKKSPKLQDPFEYPRQMENNDGANRTPEIMQFKASQKLLSQNQNHDPNKTYETFSTTKGSTTATEMNERKVPLTTTTTAGKPSQPTLYPDITKTCEKLLAQNPVERVEVAHQFACENAQFRDGLYLRSIGYGYKITKELSRSCFGFTYEGIQIETCKKVWIKSEPMTDDETMKKFKTLKNELLIMQQILKSKPLQREHFVELLDSGCTDQFKFLVTEYLGDNLYTITRMYLNNAFTKSTALRVSIQMLRSLIDLHTIGYIHRFIKPHIYAIGIGPTQIKTIHLFDFSLAFAYRDKAGKVLRPRRKVKILGALRYTSRHSHLNQELSRRDDLESWFYLSLEFFYLNVLPWKGDQISASVLYKKQKLFDGDFTRVFKKVPEEYRTIMKYINKLKYSETPNYQTIMDLLEQARISQNIDFSLPYDWENLPDLLLLKKSKREEEEKPEYMELKPPPQEINNSEKAKKKSPSSADCEPKIEAKSDNMSSSRREAITKFQATPKHAIDDLIDVNISTTTINEKNHHHHGRSGSSSNLIQNVHLDLLRKKQAPPPQISNKAATYSTSTKTNDKNNNNNNSSSNKDSDLE